MFISFHKIISASLSPNAESDDVVAALRILLQPWRWKGEEHIHKVEKWFCEYFRVPYAVTFNSGRSALLAILRAFDIGLGDEVLLQAFTCVAVPNSVSWAGARPVYVDIDASLNIDRKDIEKKITKKTRAIIVQHTFGVPADMDGLVALAKKYNLILIEDCAHSLGATYHGKKIGTFGDASFFSFGRDKVLSSVFGGLAIIQKNHEPQTKKLQEYHESLPYPAWFWIFQQLFHPVAFAFIIPTYNLGIGKIVLVVLQKLHLLSYPVYPEEKVGKKPSDFPTRYSNGHAKLILNQLLKLDHYNETRRRIAQLYWDTLSKKGTVTLFPQVDGAIYLRFPVRVSKPDEVARSAKAKGILLGNWYHHTIDPRGVDLTKIGYTSGSCPRAENASLHILNLPTRISSAEATRVAQQFS